MSPNQIESVVLAIYDKYLSTLTTRKDDLTTLVWGWQENAKRFASPERLAKKQTFVPFLFRPVDKVGVITHCALSGLVLHKDDRRYPPLAAWLEDHRVENYAKTNWNENVVAYYVVTSCKELPNPIAFNDLNLASEDRPLNEYKTRGYALVDLPSPLEAWYDDAINSWIKLESSLPKSAA